MLTCLTTAILLAHLGPSRIAAQCSVTNTTTTMFGSFIIITKTLNTQLVGCAESEMMVFGCGGAPTNTMPTMLVASAYTMMAGYTSPSCSWVCTCPVGSTTGVVFTIDGSDGLPVELMDFTIESTGEASPTDR